MISVKHCKVLFTIYLLTEFVTSLELKKSDDPFDTRIARKLVKYLDEKIKEVLGVEVHRNKTEDGTGNVGRNPVKYKSFKAYHGDINKILVKRIVPHGFPVTKYEVTKYNTRYRPLFRIHKTRGTNPETATGSIAKDSDPINVNLLYILAPSDISKSNPLKSYIQNDKYPMETYDDVSKLKQKKIKSALDNAQNYVDFLLTYLTSKDTKSDKHLQNYKGILRSPIYTKSGEHHEIISSAMFPGPKTEETTKKPKWLPKYPPWSYWTYKKSIYQDECPGLQINIGGMCVWIPPH